MSKNKLGISSFDLDIKFKNKVRPHKLCLECITYIDKEKVKNEGRK